MIALNISFSLTQEYLKLVSFNIHGFKQSKNLNRINEIIDNLDGFDIILLQENWGYQNLFLKRLKNFNFFFGDTKRVSFLDTGLTNSFSNRINILEYEEMLFTNCSGYLFRGSDCLSSKGCVYSKINFKGNIIDIFNTHLDSGVSKKDKITRQKQINELKEFIKSKKSNMPFIVCGDFNIDYFSNEKKVIEKFMLDLNLDIINLNKKYNGNKKIDYILSSKIENLMHLKLNDRLYHLSDHYPESVMFQIR